MRQRICVQWLASAVLMVFSTAAAHATEGVVVADTYVNSAHPTVNYGSLSNLYVNGTGTTLIQFDLASLPNGTTSSQIGAAYLKLWVNRVNTSGAVNLQPVTGAWNESTLTYSGFGSLTLGTGTSFTTTTAEQFIVIDVTALVQNWVNGTANNGIALTSAGGDVVFDSKENDETSHAAHLDITVTSQGPAGTPGVNGTGATIGIGSTTTGAAGTNASVTNTGTTTAAIFNFTIPKGATGAQGVQGNQGTAGQNGAAGPPGQPGAVGGAWISGMSYSAGQVVTSSGNMYVATTSNTASSSNEPGASGGASDWAGVSPGSSFAWSQSFLNSTDANINYIAPSGGVPLSTLYTETAGAGDLVLPASCTVRSMKVNQFFLTAGTETTVIELLHNGNNTNMSCSITANTGIASCSSTSANSFFASSGDTLEYAVEQTNVSPKIITTVLLTCN